MSKNKITGIVLATIGSLLLFDALTTCLVYSNISIVLTSLIMMYLLGSGAINTKKESQRIQQNNILHWKYNRIIFDWNTLLMVAFLLYGQSTLAGTVKYIILIQGLLFLLLFMYNTYSSITNRQQLLAIESNRLINIQNKTEEIELTKFSIVESTSDLLSIKSRWRTIIKIKRDDFLNSDGMLEIIADKIEAGSMKNTSI